MNLHTIITRLRRRAARFALPVAACGVIVAASAGCASHAPTGEPPAGASGGAASYPIPTLTTSAVPATMPSTPLPAPSTLPPEFAGLDRRDPTAVAIAAVRIWYTADTRTDLSPQDARLRACPLLTTAYCDTIRDFPPLSGPGSDWLALTADSTSITVGPGDVLPAAETAPPDDAARAVRLFEVTEHLSTPTGQRPDRRLVVAVSLIHDDAAGWQVVQVKPR